MQPVLTIAEMQAVDAGALASTPLDELVGRAGTAVAGAALDLLGGAYGRRVVVIAGKGNNGADGRVAARLLAARGARVRLVAPGELDRIGAVGPRVDLVVDAAFGTGFRGSYEAPEVAAGTPVLAVDIPSGVDGDTGMAQGRPLAATRTVTFVALKPGLVQGDGERLAGAVTVVDIGLPTGSASIAVLEDGDVGALVPPRDVHGNKWSAAVLVVAGSPGMTGAAALCARGAYRAGAGMVRLGVPGADLACSPSAEAVGVALPAGGWATAALEEASRCRSVVVGPGIGRAPDTACGGPPTGGRVAGAGPGRRRRVGRARSDRPAARGACPGRPHPPRRRVRAADRRATRPGPHRRGPPPGLGERRGGAPEGCDHRGGRPVGPGPARSLGHPGPGHGRAPATC